MAWTTAGNLRGPAGSAGPAGVSVSGASVDGQGNLLLALSNGGTLNAGRVLGERGADGTSVSIQGGVANAAALPGGLGPSDAGDGYITQDDGHLHVWDGDSFNDVGTVRGPEGQPGPKGDTGARGSKWFTGVGAPTGGNTAGSLPGDMYLDTASGDVYTLT